MRYEDRGTERLIGAVAMIALVALAYGIRWIWIHL